MPERDSRCMVARLTIETANGILQGFQSPPTLHSERSVAVD